MRLKENLKKRLLQTIKPALTFAIISGAVFASTNAAADYVWTGAADGVSLYNEGNWVIDGTANTPPANSINGNAVVGDNLVVNSGTVGGPTGAGPHLVLGGNSLIMSGGTLLMSGTNGIRQGSIDITGGKITAQFLADGFNGSTTLGTQVTLGGTGIIELKGGGVPLNHGSTVNFTSTDSQLIFLAETSADSISEHASKISFNGSPANWGSDPAVEEAGDNFIITPAGAGSIWQAVAAAPPPTYTGPLVVHLNIEETAGSTTADQSVNGLDGTLNGPTFETIDIPTPQNTATSSALRFDGVDDTVNIDGYDGILGDAARTVMAWIKTDVEKAHTIVNWGGAGSGGRFTFRINENESNGVLGALRVEVAGGFIIGEENLQDGEWHHVAATFDPTDGPGIHQVKLYVDGIFQDTTQSAGNQVINTVAGGDVLIGEGPVDGVDRHFNGLIDEVRIYDVALDPQAISDLAASIPEPGSIALMLLALSGVSMRRQRG